MSRVGTDLALTQDGEGLAAIRTMNLKAASFGGLTAILALAAQTVGGATLHVSPSAGGEGTGSAAAPFRSLDAALAAVAPGDTILMQQGTHRVRSMCVVNQPGIKIIAVTGEKAVLVAPEDVPAVLSITASRVTLQDLVLQGGFYGLKIDVDDEQVTRGVVIRNCTIGSTGADCIKSYNADELLIEGCQLGPSGARQKDNAEGIDVIGSVGVTIRNCLIEDTATNGIYLKGGTRDGVVERCFIRRAGDAGILLGQDTDEEYMRDKSRYEAINCVARNNIIVGARAAGVGAYSAKGISFLNNTLLDVAREVQAGLWVVTNGRDVPSEQVQFRGNIVVIAGDRPAIFLKDAAGLPESDHNLFFSRKGDLRFIRELSGDESMNRQWDFKQWQASAGMDTHSRLADPKLDDKHYRPVSGSPAIGKGRNIKGLEDDYFGARRNAESPDIGAVCASAAIPASR